MRKQGEFFHAVEALVETLAAGLGGLGAGECPAEFEYFTQEMARFQHAAAANLSEVVRSGDTTRLSACTQLDSLLRNRKFRAAVRRLQHDAAVVALLCELARSVSRVANVRADSEREAYATSGALVKLNRLLDGQDDDEFDAVPFEVAPGSAHDTRLVDGHYTVSTVSNTVTNVTNCNANNSEVKPVLGRPLALARAAAQAQRAVLAVEQALVAHAARSVRFAQLWAQVLGPGPYAFGAERYLDKTQGELAAVQHAVRALRTVQRVCAGLHGELARVLPAHAGAAAALAREVVGAAVAHLAGAHAAVYVALAPAPQVSQRDIIGQYEQTVRFSRQVARHCPGGGPAVARWRRGVLAGVANSASVSAATASNVDPGP